MLKLIIIYILSMHYNNSKLQNRTWIFRIAPILLCVLFAGAMNFFPLWRLNI